jgi:hypothetical protein
MRTSTPDGKVQAGRVVEVVVECDPALGPYASDRWREALAHAHLERGVKVEHFELARLSVREADLAKAAL